MTRAATVLAIGLAVVAAPAAAKNSDADGATQMLRRLYGEYANPMFSPLKDDGHLWFDDSLVALIRKDRDPAGEIGRLDFDPICQCQDSGGLRASVHPAKLVSPTTAVADVDLRFSTAAPEHSSHLTLTLVLERGRWRIHDIGAPGMKSLRAFMIDGASGQGHGRQHH